VFYIMGNYKGSGPMYRRGRMKFTARELWDNWQLLKGHAKKEGMHG